MSDIDKIMDGIGKSNPVNDGTGMGSNTGYLRNTAVNWKLLVFTLILSVIVWIVDLLLYNALKDSIPRPLMIGIVFAILTLALGILLLISGQNAGNNVQPGMQAAGVAVGTALMLVLASLFQYIYQISLKQHVIEPTSYIFVIDDSGSMVDNDPEGKRYKAIPEILKDKPDGFPYMVYGFSSSAYVLRDMAPKSDGMEPIEGMDSGGTAIAGALEQVIEDYKNGVWEGGKSPKVILLTDGEATDILFDFMIDGTLKKYVKERISISCVGLGSIDRVLMERIASETGGVFIDVQDSSQLSEALRTAAKSYKDTDRDLVSERLSGGIVYALMRVVFLTLLGGLLSIAKYFAYGDRDSSGKIIVITLAASFIGALLMEIGTAIGLPAAVMWLILWALYSATLADKSTYVQTDIVENRGFPII